MLSSNMMTTSGFFLKFVSCHKLESITSKKVKKKGKGKRNVGCQAQHGIQEKDSIFFGEIRNKTIKK